MNTLREKLMKLGISDVFVNKLEDEYKQMDSTSGQKTKGLTQEEYVDHIERCRRLAWQILSKLDQTVEKV